MNAKIERAKRSAVRAVESLVNVVAHEASRGKKRLSECRLCDTPLVGKVAKGRPPTICDKCRKVTSRDYQRDYKRKVRSAERALREEGAA